MHNEPRDHLQSGIATGLKDLTNEDKRKFAGHENVRHVETVSLTAKNTPMAVPRCSKR